MNSPVEYKILFQILKNIFSKYFISGCFLIIIKKIMHYFTTQYIMKTCLILKMGKQPIVLKMLEIPPSRYVFFQ